MSKNLGKDKPLKIPYPMILASTSSYRLALLKQLGLPFTAEKPQINEDEYKDLGLSPEHLAIHLAKLKAHNIFQNNPHSCVIGSDQVCKLNNLILGKPNNRETAIQQLNLLQGKEHCLITAVAIYSPQGIKQFSNLTRLSMRALNLDEINSYLDFDHPFDCAGSYKLESGGIKLFKKIEMSDHTSIIGLPLIELTEHLLALGYPLGFQGTYT